MKKEKTQLLFVLWLQIDTIINFDLANNFSPNLAQNRFIIA